MWLKPTKIPFSLQTGVYLVVNQVWALISEGLYLLSGSPTKIYLIKSRASWLIKPGIENLPIKIFLYSSVVSGSSNGRKPQIKAKSMIPQDHISTYVPIYFLPAIISGAA